jgi:hypothetical protein
MIEQYKTHHLMPDKRFQDKVVMIELDKLVHRNNSDQKVLNHLQLVFERELVEMSHNNLDENNDHENIV